MSVPPVKETIEQYGLESQPRMSFSTTSGSGYFLRWEKFLSSSATLAMSDIGGGAEALRGFPSLISIDPLRKNIQDRWPISKPT